MCCSKAAGQQKQLYNLWLTVVLLMFSKQLSDGFDLSSAAAAALPHCWHAANRKWNAPLAQFLVSLSNCCIHATEIAEALQWLIIPINWFHTTGLHSFSRPGEQATVSSFKPQTNRQIKLCLHVFYFHYLFTVNIFRVFLTSTVHKFTDIGCGHDLIGAQIVSNLTANGHNDGHDKVGKCRNYPNLC